MVTLTRSKVVSKSRKPEPNKRVDTNRLPAGSQTLSNNLNWNLVIALTLPVGGRSLLTEKIEDQPEMKKLSIVFGIALVALIAIVGFRGRREDDPTAAKAPATGHVAPRERLESDAIISREMRPPRAATRKNADSEKEEVESLRRELETARAQLEKITRPLEQDVLSSTVNAEINPGETLVTGGYRTADGNYELTLLTPRSVTLEDGREAIEVDGKVLSVGSEFVGAHGLETLTTNARNTLQHAEAWKQDDVARTLVAASNVEGAGILSSPKVITLPSTPFTLSFSETDGAQFSIEGTVARSPSGSLAIRSRIERTPKAEQEAGAPNP